MPNKNYKELLSKLGIKVNNYALYEAAFTHASYKNENKNCVDYDRLEFIGDAVLSLFVGEMIYLQFKDMNSGELSKCRSSLVRGNTEANIAKELGFEDYIKVSKALEKSGGANSKILEDVFEAFIGAFYLDNLPNIQITKDLINKYFADLVTHYDLYENFDYKSKFQEEIQKEIHNSGKIVYEKISESGPDNEKWFVVEVKLAGVTLGTGEGKSLKKAEQAAAKNALEKKVI